MSWNMPVHHRPGYDKQDARDNADVQSSSQDARTARTVAEHATDAEDCRVLLEMLGLRLDVLRAEKPPADRQETAADVTAVWSGDGAALPGAVPGSGPRPGTW